jgi:hypothetical protein
MRTRMVSKSYGSEVLSRLRSLQQCDMLCDFTVCAEGKSLRVSVLCQQFYDLSSQVLINMLIF